MLFDIVHFNLHKTFATPHGGGGPGAGPVGVRAALEPYLPIPRIVERSGRFDLDYDRPKSIGKVRFHLGNVGVLLRAYANILRWGGDGMAWRAERAVLNSCYLMKLLEGLLEVPFPGPRKHEFVASAVPLRDRGLRAVDLAKALMDYGVHPPTVYFPSLVEEALMVEPTESESKDTLDGFAAAIREILERPPEEVKKAPAKASVSRVDEVLAARNPILSWRAYRAFGEGRGRPAEAAARPAEAP
jgi:glycine dehydrogenase subunit 2